MFLRGVRVGKARPSAAGMPQSSCKGAFTSYQVLLTFEGVLVLSARLSPAVSLRMSRLLRLRGIQRYSSPCRIVYLWPGMALPVVRLGRATHLFRRGGGYNETWCICLPFRVRFRVSCAAVLSPDVLPVRGATKQFASGAIPGHLSKLVALEFRVEIGSVLPVADAEPVRIFPGVQ
jgi:hypothetical protein